MKIQNLILVTVFVLAASAPLMAHHSFAAEFDDQKPVKISGVVTKVEWQNPHVWFYVDVKDENGKVTNWAFAGGAPGQLMRRGVSNQSIKPGMMVMVEGFRAKDGSNNASGGRVTFPDGRNVFVAASEDPGTSEKK